VSEYIIIDTNLVFSALVTRESRLRERLMINEDARFCCPRFLFVELFKHKERILRASQLSEDELLEFLSGILSKVEFIEEGLIPMGTWLEAHRLCRDTDANDTPFVALTLHLDGLLWTNDEDLKRGLHAKGFDWFYDPLN
jgi:predicted nucleic acid-binding protein